MVLGERLTVYAAPSLLTTETVRGHLASEQRGWEQPWDRGQACATCSQQVPVLIPLLSLRSCAPSSSSLMLLFPCL